MSGALDNLDMEDYLSSSGVDFRATTGSKGPQFNLKECPRCGGSDWKVFMGRDSGFGNCFHGSCVGQPGYNKYTFIRELTGLSSKDTMKHIEDFVKLRGWRPPTKKEDWTPKTAKGAELPEARFEAIRYLTKRGFDESVIRYFGWLYSEDGCFEYMGREDELVSQSYAGRVIIPVCDLAGRIVTFQGRDTTGTANRKYLFPPGLPGTGRYLYNANNVLGKERVAMGEGAFDVAALHCALDDMGVGSIGSFGKSLSGSTTVQQDDQLGQLIELKRSGLKELTFMWDGESKTIEDACKAALKVRSIGLKVKIGMLPEGKDPNEVSEAVVRHVYANAVTATLPGINRLRAKLKLGVR